MKSFYDQENVFHIDFLKVNEFKKYTRNPERLRQELLAEKQVDRVILDEVQKVPDLLDEVHWLIENTDIKFCLCGSSARKLKEGRPTF